MKIFPPLSTLRTFESAARHLSFKVAADELCVTPSSVSHQIKKLETWLGAMLFIRLNRNISLTPDGRTYQSIIAKALADISEGTALVRRKPGNQVARKRLVIGANSGFIDCWLNARLEDFKKIAPDIELKFIYGDDLVACRNQEADVAIIYSTVAPTIGGTIRLARYGEFVICSPETRINGKPLEKLADIAKMQLLHEQDCLSWKSWLEEFNLSDVDFLRGPIYQNTHSIISRVIAGDGIAMADLLVAGDALLNGDVVKPFRQTRLSDWTTYLVPMSPDSTTQEINQFSDWLIQSMQRYEAEMQVLEKDTTYPKNWAKVH